MWTKITMGPAGSAPPRLGHAVVPPGGVEHGLERRAGRLLVEQRHAVGVADDAGQLVVVVSVFAFGERRPRALSGVPARLVRPLAVGQADLDHERVAAVHGRRPGHRGVELALDLLVQAVEDRLLADGRDAVRRRRHDLGRLDGLVERLGVVRRGRCAAARPARAWPSRRSHCGQPGGDPAEVAREEPRERVALGVVEHRQQHAELDAVGMRLDLARLGRQLVDRPRILRSRPPACGRRASRAGWRWPSARGYSSTEARPFW